MNNTLGSIIKKYRVQHGLSMDRFAALSGLSKAYISMLEKNINPKTGKAITPTLDTYNQVAAAIGLSVDQLIDLVDSSAPIRIDSKTRPLNSSERAILEPFNKLNEEGQKKVVTYANDLLEVPAYEHVEYVGKAAAGSGVYNLDEIITEVTIPKKDRPAYDFIVKVSGDSMEPLIPDNSLAFVRVSTEFLDNKIYVIDYGNEVYIKKVVFGLDHIKLKSINKNYKDINIKNGFYDVRILGEVVDWS